MVMSRETVNSNVVVSREHLIIVSVHNRNSEVLEENKVKRTQIWWAMRVAYIIIVFPIGKQIKN